MSYSLVADAKYHFCMANDLGARKKNVVRQLDLGGECTKQLYLSLNLHSVQEYKIMCLVRLRMLTVLRSVLYILFFPDS